MKNTSSNETAFCCQSSNVSVVPGAECCVAQSCPTLCNPMDCSPPGSSVHGDSPGKNTGVGYHALLQGIFPTQGLNPGLPYCRQILYHLSHQGSPNVVKIQLSHGSSLYEVMLFQWSWGYSLFNVVYFWPESDDANEALLILRPMRTSHSTMAQKVTSNKKSFQTNFTTSLVSTTAKGMCYISISS